MNKISYENLQLFNQPFRDDLISVFQKVLDKGWFILGEEVENFEEEFARFCNSRFCIGVASGLDALALSIRAADFPSHGEIIVPSNTYIATILSILNEGFKPVLVEPDIRTYNIDPGKIEEKINKRTVAIMVVHLYGKCCDMDPIVALAEKNDLIIIEDCAQSHGAKYKDKISGNFGRFGAFSFYPTKNLGAMGDAGAIICHIEKDRELLKKLRNYGCNKKYYNEVIGFNSRLDEVQAAFLRVKLKKLDDINSHKRKLAKIYFEELTDEVIKPVVDEDYYDVYHIYNIRSRKRDKLKEFLLKQNITTEIHYPVPPHKQKALGNILGNESFPIAEEIHATTLSLPISYFHTAEDILRVCREINNFF